MKLFTVVLVLILITGCQSIIKPDNRAWTNVSCSGFVGWEACKQKASETCPKGYDTANQEEDYVSQHRSMEFSCK